jgi:hypothetical protein
MDYLILNLFSELLKEPESTSHFIMPTGSAATSPPLTRSSTPASISSTTLTPFKTDLMTRLNIPFDLADRTDGSLHFAYQKYKAFLEATDTLASLCASGEWEGKRPSVTDLIEIFQSKSMWHAHHAKAFSRVVDYPEMVSWLERRDDAPSNIGLWGFQKAAYHFKDLFAFLEDKAAEVGKSGGKNREKSKPKNDSGGGSSGSKKKGDKKKKSSK